MKNGFKTSEFFLACFTAAICGGAQYLGHPVDYISLFNLSLVVCPYILGRLGLKSIIAWQEAKKINPSFNTDLENITATIVPLVIAEINKRSAVGAAIAQTVINKEVKELEK